MSLFWLQHQAFQQTASAGGTAYAQAVLALSPTAYWRLGESSGDPADSSGNGHTLTAGGTPTYDVSGWTGDGDGGITLDGTDYLTVTDDADWDVGTNDFSVVWAMDIAVDSWSAERMIIGHSGSGALGEWRIYLQSLADRLRVQVRDATTGVVSGTFTTSADLLDPGDWVWCAVTCDRSGNATLYVNGTSLDAGSEYTDDISAGVAYDATNALNLNLGTYNTSGGSILGGSLDEVAFWNGTVLSQSQVQALYDARNGTGGGGGASPTPFETVMGGKSASAWWRLGEPSGTTATDEEATQNGTYTGSPTLGETGWTGDGDTAVTLDGSTQYVSIADNAAWDVGTSDFSIMAAVSIDAWNSTEHKHIVARGNGAGTGDWAMFFSRWNTNYIGILLQGTAYYIDAGTTLAGTGFHIYGLSLDRSGDASLYVDGSLAGTVDISADSATDLTGTRPLTLGATDTGSLVTNYLAGTIDECAVWNGTLLSATDWSDIYAARNA